jgi:hypothetical protein
MKITKQRLKEIIKEELSRTLAEAQNPQDLADIVLRQVLRKLNRLPAQSEDLGQLFFTTDREEPLEALRKNVSLLFTQRLHSVLYDFDRPGHEGRRPAFTREERQLLAQTAISNSKEEFSRVLADMSKRYEPVAAERADVRAGR